MSEEGIESIPAKYKRWALATSILASLIIGMAFSVVAFSTETPTDVDTGISLGVWQNMPSTPTELMGNVSYRGILPPPIGGSGLSGIKVFLSVNCIVTSNNPGAQLQLQYAIFSLATNPQSIITGFQNIGGIAFIDTTGSPTCNPALGNNFVSTGDGLLNTTLVNQGYIFRVLGSNGGGLGDNPRFASVTVVIEQQQDRIFYLSVLSRTATQFIWNVYATIAPTSSQLVNIEWIATNTTSIGCTLLCIQHGTSSCTITATTFSCSPSITVVFGTAFIGTPDVTLTTRALVGQTVTIDTGTINLLSAQTVTA